MDLVDQIKKQFSDADIHQLSSMIGASDSATRSAVGAAVPSLLSALSGLASSGQGAQRLVSALGQVGTGSLGNVSAMLHDSSGAVIEKGSNLMNSLFGGQMLPAITNGVSRFAGVAWGGCQKLLSFLTPAVLGAVASRFAGKAVNPQGLAGLFSAERASIANAIPSGFSLPDVGGAINQAAGAVGHVAASAGHAAGQAARQVGDAAQGAASSISRWLIPLLLAIGVAWLLWAFFSKKSTPAPSTPALPELSSSALAWKSDATAAITSVTDTFATIKDAPSMDAAIPKLRDLDQKLEDLRLQTASMPAAARTAVGAAVTPVITKIKDMLRQALTIPGATEKLKPLADSILEKLGLLAG
jgi:hypothetical protein